MKEKTLVSVFLVFSLVLLMPLLVKTPSQPITSAFIISNVTSNLNMTGEITGGGHDITVGNIKVKTYVGQAVVGVVNNSIVKVCFGVSCKIGRDKPTYSVNFTGQLNYSNGTAIAYKPITAYITYGDTYSQSNITNNDGEFLIVVNTPNLQGVIFNVKFYVESEIEATYECTYDPDYVYLGQTGWCI